MTNQMVLEKLQTNEDFADRYDVIAQDGVLSRLVAKDYGDLPISVTSDAVKTRFTSPLIKVSDVEDAAALNYKFLRVNGSGQVALSNFGIEQYGDDEYYVIVGELSTDSKPEVMLLEVNILAANAIDVLESL